MTFRLNFTWIARLLAILAVGEAVLGIVLVRKLLISPERREDFVAELSSRMR